MKQVMNTALLVIMSIMMAPLAGCGGPEFAEEGEGAPMLDPAAMMKSAEMPAEGPDGGSPSAAMPSTTPSEGSPN